MDPAVFGTLTIGLDNVRRQELDDDQPIGRAPRLPERARRPRLAGTLASALRGMADVLEPALDPVSRPTRRLTP